MITNVISDVVKFIDKHKSIVSKPQSELGLFSFENANYSNYTTIINKEYLLSAEKIPTTFFQEQLIKSYEVRVFYFYGKCYSMAIFSQLDSQTSVDFRHYNNKNPNRNVPYELKKELQDKIKKLMETLGLDTGSLDFVKTIDGRLVFLEVNPVGQFGMVSFPCNYYIEQIIADHLIKENK